MANMPRIVYREKITLILGDVFVFLLSLWLTIGLRRLTIPGFSDFLEFASSFSILLIVWLLVFFISGLYESHTNLIKSKVPKIVVTAQAVNILLAAVFFYFFSQYQNFGITPKTNLFIYCFISTSLIGWWRIFLYSKISNTRKVKALLIATGDEMNELKNEINNNTRYPFSFETVIDIESESDRQKLDSIIKEQADEFEVIVLDVNHQKVEPVLSDLYKLIFKDNTKSFIEFVSLYEEIFRRVPLSSLDHQWFIENISVARKGIYDFIKRVEDIVLAGILSIAFFILYPFVAIAIKLEDKGEVLIKQDRVGENGKIISLLKFRSMTGNEDGKWVSEGTLRVTKVGMFLRKSRIDELPQLLSVLNGDISLIGPRPDIKGLSDRLKEEIPYYEVRTIVKPGLSGWAQVTQEGRPPQTVDETKLRLSYDFYYIKHRSAWLDLSIALKTIKTLLMRVGV